MLTLETIKNQIEADLNEFVQELGFVDDTGVPLVYFHGEVSTYDDYSWKKSYAAMLNDELLKNLPITPFVLILESSTESSGQLITEKLQEYSLFIVAKYPDREMIRTVLDTYMEFENHDNNLVELGDSKVLKKLTNFSVGEEQLLGAPDGIGRCQISLTITYNLFENSLLTSNDVEVTIDGEAVPFRSIRLDKNHMISPTVPNTGQGTTVPGISMSGAMGSLHELSIVIDFYLDRNSDVVKRILEDATSVNLINREYVISIKDANGEVLNFSHPMVVQGTRLAMTPPQLLTVPVTFGFAYARVNVQMKLLGDTNYTTLPVLGGKLAHVPALLVKAYMGDNATKNTIIGGAKSASFIVPVLRDNPLIATIVKEVLNKVYTNKYQVKLVYLGVEQEYTWILTDTAIEFSDSVYDTIQLSFAEAK